jgi:hypothetical protein
MVILTVLQAMLCSSSVAAALAATEAVYAVLQQASSSSVFAVTVCCSMDHQSAYTAPAQTILHTWSCCSSGMSRLTISVTAAVAAAVAQLWAAD